MSLRKDDIVILILNILIYLNKNPVIPVKPDITFTRATSSDIFMKSHSMAQLNKILLIPGRLSGNIRPVLFSDRQDCFNHGCVLSLNPIAVPMAVKYTSLFLYFPYLPFFCAPNRTSHAVVLVGPFLFTFCSLCINFI